MLGGASVFPGAHFFQNLVGGQFQQVGVVQHSALGAQFLLWEYDVAVAGRLIGINPFDQPDGESAKAAARGLLDWSMGDLAEASGLSLSTIRRLEEGSEGPAARSRHAAIEALRRAGIGFVLLDGGAIAVAKVR